MLLHIRPSKLSLPKNPCSHKYFSVSLYPKYSASNSSLYVEAFCAFPIQNESSSRLQFSAITTILKRTQRSSDIQIHNITNSETCSSNSPTNESKIISVRPLLSYARGQ